MRAEDGAVLVMEPLRRVGHLGGLMRRARTTRPDPQHLTLRLLSFRTEGANTLPSVWVFLPAIAGDRSFDHSPDLRRTKRNAPATNR